MSDSPQKTGLSLSGGGYRAAAFHLGTLRKLHELNILNKISIISTISGGSITGAYYALNKENFKVFYNSLYRILSTKNIVKHVLLSVTFFRLLFFALLFLAPAFYSLFTPYAWLFPVLVVVFLFFLLKFQFHIFPVSRRIEKLYDEFLFNYKKLSDLPTVPELVMGATNIQTAKPFTFSKSRMQDSTYEYMKPPVLFRESRFPVSRAVMASSSVPFAFTPVTIDRIFFGNPANADIVRPLLVDGGVYDNQGIHNLTQKGHYECSAIIVSDAGGKDSGELSFRNVISLLVTTLNVFMARIKKVQMVQDVYHNAATAGKEIAYFSLGWDVENCIPGFIDNLVKNQIAGSVIDAHRLEAEWIKRPADYQVEIKAWLERRTGYAKMDKPTPEEKVIARNVGTNLTSLSIRKMDSLIRQAAVLTELQVRLYCPSLIPAQENKEIIVR